uniref:Uncharacterized protein n=1 Tax=Romanomermis culicivorax TaxID=13658 RepID=A0A915HQU6_ROMCU
MEIDADINPVTHAMTKKPINQPTLSDPMLFDADYMTPPVEAIAITTQDKNKRAQAADPATLKIIATLQSDNAAKHPTVFFTRDGILYRQIRDQCQLVIPASMVD